MIKVDKSNVPVPGILSQRGSQLTNNNCAEYDKFSNCYLSGVKKFTFERDVYGHKSVKDSLKDLQNNKCCYCEGKVTAHGFGSVEHYRPKAAVRQTRSSQREYPGYYWLAYSWDNLYFCCDVCNNKKLEIFPLQATHERARSHNDDLDIEQPLVLNPGGDEDPQDHIKFKGARAAGEASTLIGRKTIEIVDLNREDLIESRLEHFNFLKSLIDMIKISDARNTSGKNLNRINNARQRLKAASGAKSQYSAMASCLITSSNIPMH